MLQSLAFYVTIAIAIVSHYVYALAVWNKYLVSCTVISIYKNNQVQYDYSDIKAATM